MDGVMNQPVVIDNGTSSLKAGFAGSSKPKVSPKTNLCYFFVAKRFRVTVTIGCNVVSTTWFVSDDLL